MMRLSLLALAAAFASAAACGGGRADSVLYEARPDSGGSDASLPPADPADASFDRSADGPTSSDAGSSPDIPPASDTAAPSDATPSSDGTSPPDGPLWSDGPLLDGVHPGDGGYAPDVPPDGIDPPLEPPKLTTRRLVTRGNVLVDELGRAVILRGVNVGGRSKMPPFLPFDFTAASEIPGKAEQLMSSIQKLGANAVRLTFSWEALESARGTFDAEYLGRYRALLDAADKAELHVIVDFHQDVFHASFCGDGFPEWALGDIPHGPPHYDCAFPLWSLPYFDPASTVSQAFDRFWSNADGLLDSFEAMWRHVAREVGRHRTVAAFEIINEPGVGSSAIDTMGTTVLPQLYDRIATTIETEAGPAAILGDEPVSTASDVRYLARPNHPRFVYGPHYYDSLTMLGIGPLDTARIRTAVAAVLGRITALNAPVVLGEFGAPNSVSFKADYLSAIFDALDASYASAMLWDVSASDLRWNAEDFGPLLTNGTELPWAHLLDRPVPRAIDGTVGRLVWNTLLRQFELTVSAAGDQISEVYLPVRHLGSAPELTVTGARWRWLPQTGQLLVAASRGASWSVLARPKP